MNKQYTFIIILLSFIAPTKSIVGATEPNYFSLAYTYLQEGRVDDAIAAYQALLQQMPNTVPAIYNMGYALKMRGEVPAAIACYKKAIALDPNYDAAQFALGHAYLHNGDFTAGWKQHERYLQQSGKNAPELRALLKNNSIAGKTVLLVPEGGLGDTINFIRYAQLLKEEGAHVIAQIQKPLVPLLSRCPFIDQIVPSGSPRPAHDAWSTLMSLPAVFNSDEDTIPKNIPYIFPPETVVSRWKERLAHDKNFKIGICWQADVFNDSSRLPVARRGIPLEKLYPLADISGVSIYSLQKFDGTEQLKTIPATCQITCFDESTFDITHGAFMDTAAVMQHLDLVISVDTAISHLAGALGIPIWLLLPYSTDWRWIAHRTDSPWYPTMRIFKQSAPFDWDTVMSDLLLELIERVQCALKTKS